jgi:SPP1 gp7 family putative phage head morphogenesis protein
MSQNAKVGKSSPVISQVNVARVTLRNQDMADVQSAINAARSVDNPRRKQLYELYQNLRYDGHLHAVLTKRSTNVANKKVVWVQDGASDEQMARIQEDILNTPWFYDFITGCMEVVPYGTTVLELIPQDGLIGRCEVVPRANVVPEMGHISKDASNTTTPFIMYRDDPYWSTYLVEVGKPHDLGAMMIALPYILYKRGSFGDWAQFSELFGMPFRVGHYNPWDESTRTKLLTALSEMGGAGYAVIPDGTSLDFHSTPSGTGKGEIYKDLIATCNAELSKIFLGNTLTTEQGENGARSLGDVHASVEEDLALADMRRIEFLLNWELKERLVKLGYPVADGHFAFDVTVGLPLAERVKVDTLVAQQIDVPPSYWRETYGMPEPNAQDLAEMAKRPKAPAAPKDPATPPKKEEVTEPEDEVDRAPDSATLRKELQALYHGHGHSHPDVAAGPEFTGSAAIMEELAKAMHDGRITEGFVDPKLMQWTADQLTRGVMEGFDIDDAVEFQSDPLRAYMQRNLMVFSGFKTYQTLRAASDLLMDDSGQFRPFGEFKKLILDLDAEYNTNYLRTEYNHGVASGQMAQRWSDIQETKELFPYLKYSTVGDDRVRDTHAALDGVVKPVDDAFWNSNYPPNGWNCRCIAQKVRRLTGKEKTLAPDQYPSNPPMFANNVGKSGTVFPNTHPYYQAPTSVQAAVEVEVMRAMGDTGKKLN